MRVSSAGWFKPALRDCAYFGWWCFIETIFGISFWEYRGNMLSLLTIMRSEHRAIENSIEVSTINPPSSFVHSSPRASSVN